MNSRLNNVPVRYRSNVFFDAYGQRRELDWRNDADHSTYGEAHWIERGYTGHEMLDNVELIHMNGRVQNPLWGRMLSPDPVIADLELPQGLNPYSYVGNNPGRWTDPTGFAWCEDDYNCTVYGWPGPSPLYWAPSLPGYYGALPSWLLTRVSAPPRACSRSRCGGPRHRTAAISRFVSTIARTGSTLGAHGVDFGLDLLLAHWRYAGGRDTVGDRE
ncbi:MAG: RHS repeat-associated core domain-containing protein [Gammaproteobacteria bacterium]